MLTMMQEMSIRDINGNCRCPYCGKYRKRSDFPDQPGHMTFGSNDVIVHAHVAAACRFCIGVHFWDEYRHMWE